MEAGIELRVLGAVEVRRAGEAVAVGGPKPRRLLAMLLARRNIVVSSEWLCNELWGEDQPGDPIGVLQSLLSRLLRVVLRPEIEIVARPPGYVLEIDDDLLDAGRFEVLCARARATTDPEFIAKLLDAALECWNGAAFEEFDEVDWARREAVRLDEMRATAQEDLIDARLALGAHADLVGVLEAMVADHPLRERRWHQLIIALYRSGRTAEALRRAAALRTLLRHELGLEPSPALRELEARVLSDDPTLLAPVHTAPSRSAHRLPVAPTTLVGRDREVDAITAQLRSHRLLTLTGPGGVGKTSLALRVARELYDEFGGEVFFAELAPVQDSASMVAAIATALDVHQRQHLSIEETLLEYLRGRRAWLVLDNCERLRTAIAPLVDRLLRWCPELSVLTTSREVLGLTGEVVWRVEPLEVAAAGADAIAVAEAPAVRLFVERAGAARVDFALDAENVDAVAEIVRRVDGLPLAIELAAARLRVMSPVALAGRLDRGLDLLDGAQTAVNARHRTLHDLVAWSYELLEPEEQHVFVQLATFAGSFGLDAVEGVCSDEYVKADRLATVLANLVDKSMVQIVDGDTLRYRLLETLREFARDRIDENDRARLGERHARFYLAVAEEAGRGLAGPNEAASAAAIERDFDNLRLAHAWAIEEVDADVALRLVAGLREYALRSMRAEVISWADDAWNLEGASSHPRAPVVIAVGAYGRFVRGDLEGAMELSRVALDLAEAGGFTTSGLAERTLGNAYFYRGAVKEAVEWTDRLIASAREGSAARLTHALYMRSVAYTSTGASVQGARLAGEASAVARQCASPTALAQAAYALGLALESTAPDEASVHLRRAVDLAHGAGNRWIEAFALTEVLWLEARQGHPREALARYADVIDIWYRGGDWANQWLSLRHVMGILVELHAYLGAATLHGALTAAGAAYALPFEASDAEHLETLVDELRNHLGPATFASAVRRGAAYTDAEIIEFTREQIRAVSI